MIMIEINSWMIPLAVSLITSFLLFQEANRVSSSGFLGNALEMMFAMIGSVIFGLVVWLVWALGKLLGWWI